MVAKGELELMMQALDGELDSPALQALLARCPECREEWARLQALEQVLTGVSSLAAPVGLVGAVMTRIERRQRVANVWGGLALAAGTAALIAVVLLPSLGAVPGLNGSPLVALHAWDMLLFNLGHALVVVLDSLWLTAGTLVAPLLLLAFCGLSTTFVAAPLWLWVVRRLRGRVALPA